MRTWWLALAVALGCDGDDELDDDTTCGVVAKFSGGTSLEVGANDAACVTPLGSSFGGFRVAFVVLGSGHALDLQVEDAVEGQVGSFPATLGIDPGGTDHEAACTATLTEATNVGPGELGTTRFRTRGTLACSPALSPTSDPTTVERFEFVATVGWP